VTVTDTRNVTDLSGFAFMAKRGYVFIAGTPEVKFSRRLNSALVDNRPHKRREMHYLRILKKTKPIPKCGERVIEVRERNITDIHLVIARYEHIIADGLIANAVPRLSKGTTPHHSGL